MVELLRRYTDVMSLLDIVRHNRLTLTSPSRWYDQNDAICLRQYGEMRGQGEVYALCLAEGPELAHHWQIFAGHNHGLCIQFDKAEFIKILQNHKYPNDILHGPVQYKSLKQIESMNPIDRDVLPFLKRDTFKAEAEYRVVAWEEDWLAGTTYSIPFSAKSITRVLIGPSTPRQLAENLKEIVRQEKGCKDIPFAISRLVNNASWAEAISKGLKLK